ncbi:type I restriction enzyme HsdR N-terminal domain-containing protein [Flavobacterium sp. 17A]|uniref:Type I restriction enzyme HsdR N-terminal domain-containing protein n=1 Tax=Flavobacterium potami TaxID=2872310 RepID=A0A9X1H8I9_9FLAO|nr:type I restriction enzyme HsdR N-terminal domain-containing protein [Flavobacterium potami]
MNEEEIRGKLLLPFLKDLGFDDTEISIEKSFTIRLGKTEKTIRGRSDILCKRFGKNLFIIELKKDSISITEQDIAQGISYARLLSGNIAPFTIISNGRSTKIFDSISRVELTGKKISEQSAFWRNDCTLSASEDLNIRYLALKNFISFSDENLRQFCLNQVTGRMGTIIGEFNDPSVKYSKELHHKRLKLQDEFMNFLKTDKSVFGIAGPAGVGKTSTICSLALQNVESDFVFFFNGSLMRTSPLELMSQDLNGVFSNKVESGTVLKKLDEIGSYLKKNVIIFIDAIDESVDPNLNLELSDLALTIRQFKNIKLCISCKSNIWKSFLFQGDTPTHLYEELKKSHIPNPLLDNCPGFFLEDFDQTEIDEILPAYQKAFDFRGEISVELQNTLKNGFFLRIFSEVYSGRQIPSIINDKDLIQKYLKQSIEKTSLENRLAMGILGQIGKILVNYKFSFLEEHQDEGVDVEKLYDELNFNFSENLPEELFSRNILLKSNNNATSNVTFYYSKIRDYIICYHSYRLDKLDNEEFYNVLNEIYQNYIGQSAIKFYIENSTLEHQETLIKYKNDKALEYVEGYNIYLEDNFRNFKKLFDPNTENEIGIIMPLNSIKDNGYALFPLKENSKSKLELVNLSHDASDEDLYTLFEEKGAKSLYGSNIPFLVADQSTIIRKNIFKDLKKALERGMFYDFDSMILNRELLSVILYNYFKELDYDIKTIDYNLPRFETIYPIDVKDLKNRLERFRAKNYYKLNKVINESMSISDFVENALNEKLPIPDLNTFGSSPPFDLLYTIVNKLLSIGITEIENHHLPAPDRSINYAKEYYRQNPKNYHLVRTIQYSETQARLYITQFFNHLETCYKEFVESCFPTFKNQLEFFTTIPHEYFIYALDADNLTSGSFGYRPSQTGKLEIYFMDRNEYKNAFKRDSIKIARHFSLDIILHNLDARHFPVPIVYRINTYNANRYTVLRNWVYKLLENDMEKLFKENDK